jgi:peptide deformylase
MEGSMSVKKVLLLGDPRLYEVSDAVSLGALDNVKCVIDDLHDTLMEFRNRNGAGRAIAAPQIGVMVRLIYLHIDKPLVIFNPVLTRMSDAMIELWDDCLCFPDLLVHVRRHKTCRIDYRDLAWQERSLDLEGDMSELLQHECDHLDGILAVSRAIDGQSFALRSQKGLLNSKGNRKG